MAILEREHYIGLLDIVRLELTRPVPREINPVVPRGFDGRLGAARAVLILQCSGEDGHSRR